MAALSPDVAEFAALPATVSDTTAGLMQLEYEFQTHDKNGDGFLDKAELRAIVRAGGVIGDAAQELLDNFNAAIFANIDPGRQAWAGISCEDIVYLQDATLQGQDLQQAVWDRAIAVGVARRVVSPSQDLESAKAAINDYVESQQDTLGVQDDLSPRELAVEKYAGTGHSADVGNGNLGELELISAGVTDLDQNRYLREQYGEDGFVDAEGLKAAVAAGDIEIDDDGNITLTEQGKAAATKWADAAGAAEQEDALATLTEHFDVMEAASPGHEPDGLLGRGDLEYIVSHSGSFSPEVVAAAQYFLDNPSVFDGMETASQGGKTDGLASLGDVKAFAALQAPETQEHLALLDTHFDVLESALPGHKSDGLLSRGDLQYVVDHPGAFSEELSKVAQYLLDNPAIFNALDTASKGGKTDGLISRGDVETFNTRAGVTATEVKAEPPPAASKEDALATLTESFDVMEAALPGHKPDGLIGRGDLQYILDHPASFSPGIVAAARYFLENPAVFDGMETASQGGKTDGLASLGDVKAFAMMQDPELRANLALLDTHFDVLESALPGHKSDGLLSRGDLQYVVDHPGAFSEELGKVAQYLLDNPEIFNALDTASKGGKTDGLISRGDLEAFMARANA